MDQSLDDVIMSRKKRNFRNVTKFQGGRLSGRLGNSVMQTKGFVRTSGFDARQKLANKKGMAIVDARQKIQKKTLATDARAKIESKKQQQAAGTVLDARQKIASKQSTPADARQLLKAKNTTKPNVATSKISAVSGQPQKPAGTKVVVTSTGGRALVSNNEKTGANMVHLAGKGQLLKTVNRNRYKSSAPQITLSNESADPSYVDYTANQALSTKLTRTIGNNASGGMVPVQNLTINRMQPTHGTGGTLYSDGENGDATNYVVQQGNGTYNPNMYDDITGMQNMPSFTVPQQTTQWAQSVPQPQQQGVAMSNTMQSDVQFDDIDDDVDIDIYDNVDNTTSNATYPQRQQQPLRTMQPLTKKIVQAIHQPTAVQQAPLQQITRHKIVRTSVNTGQASAVAGRIASAHMDNVPGRKASTYKVVNTSPPAAVKQVVSRKRAHPTTVTRVALSGADSVPAKRSPVKKPAVVYTRSSSEDDTLDLEEENDTVQPHTAPAVGQGYKLMVTNLHKDVSQNDIVELFGSVGRVKKACLVKPGIGEVVYLQKQDAQTAIKTYNMRELDGVPMKVQFATAASRLGDQPQSAALSGGNTTAQNTATTTTGGKTISKDSAASPTPEVLGTGPLVLLHPNPTAKVMSMTSLRVGRDDKTKVETALVHKALFKSKDKSTDSHKPVTFVVKV